MNLDNLRIVPYTSEMDAVWEDACATAVNGTFLHSRRFLGYHGDRFVDRSVLFLVGEKVVGVFAAAEAPSDSTLIVSHPGITYGGIVHSGALSGNRMIDALTRLGTHYRAGGHAKLRYKAVPAIYHARPSQDDLYALFRVGAVRSRCDLSCTIDLDDRAALSERRRRGLKKANKAVAIAVGTTHVTALWDVLAGNLTRKHDAAPVHTLAEISRLIDMFPEHIDLVCATIAGKVEAGIVVFKTRRVWHAQYIAASEAAYAVSALDAVFDYTVDAARKEGARYFDFGTSNEREGTVLNDGLYQYKHEYGGGGVVHEFYDINLMDAQYAVI